MSDILKHLFDALTEYEDTDRKTVSEEYDRSLYDSPSAKRQYKDEVFGDKRL